MPRTVVRTETGAGTWNRDAGRVRIMTTVSTAAAIAKSSIAPRQGSTSSPTAVTTRPRSPPIVVPAM